jgi:CHRD domain-containing protein
VTLKQCVLTVAITAVFVASAVPLTAQGTEKFAARLGWVPTAGPNDRVNVTGKGTATGTLSGRKLTINGTFEGLAAPATVARLHQGVAKGARGAAITDLTVSKGASGTLTGSVDLTAPQVEALRQGKLYIQLHSEKGVAPDGSNLWGWFLK